MRFVYRHEHIDFLSDAYVSMSVHDLTQAFNTEFGLDKTVGQINSTLKNYKITCGRKHSDRIQPGSKLYTPEKDRFLRDNYKRLSIIELTAEFNSRFSLSMTESQIRSFTRNHNVKSGRNGCFEKGLVPWNKGKKGANGFSSTRFKKGNAPPNRKPIGTERIDSKDGFILIKIAEENPYTGTPTRYKHKHVWEQAHGPVPTGMVVAFRDGKKNNCDINNLMLITRGELLCLNLHGYKDLPSELQPSVLALSKLEAKAGVRTSPGRGRKASQ